MYAHHKIEFILCCDGHYISQRFIVIYYSRANTYSTRLSLNVFECPSDAGFGTNINTMRSDECGCTILVHACANAKPVLDSSIPDSSYKFLGKPISTNPFRKFILGLISAWIHANNIIALSVFRWRYFPILRKFADRRNSSMTFHHCHVFQLGLTTSKVVLHGLSPWKQTLVLI